MSTHPIHHTEHRWALVFCNAILDITEITDITDITDISVWFLRHSLEESCILL